MLLLISAVIGTMLPISDSHDCFTPRKINVLNQEKKIKEWSGVSLCLNKENQGIISSQCLMEKEDCLAKKKIEFIQDIKKNISTGANPYFRNCYLSGGENLTIKFTNNNSEVLVKNICSFIDQSFISLTYPF